MVTDFWLSVDDQVLLLDFDGTVVVTEVLARKAILETFDEKGIRAPADFPDLITGRTWGAAVEEMTGRAKTLGLRLPSAVELKREFQIRYREALSKGVPLVPGFRECLKPLRDRARFIGLVTGSEHEEVDLILRGLGLETVFERIWAAGDYPASKPDPSPYRVALEATQSSPDSVLVFEDSVAGMESAHRAGLRFVQISHESHSPPPDPRAFLTVPDWTALSAQLKS
jgi:HAD superfamily hydrolase (TIGR01509 family)